MSACFRDGEAPDEPIEVDLKDWFAEMNDIDSDYVLEQAIPLSTTNGRSKRLPASA